jgi:hypothetical protein
MAAAARTDSAERARGFWGPPTWAMIHSTAALLREDTCGEYTKFLMLLPRVMPCGACRRHLLEKFQKLPPCPIRNLRDARSAFAYSVKLHNLVNISKTNPTAVVSPTAVTELYTKRAPEIARAAVWRMLLCFAFSGEASPDDFGRFVACLANLMPRGGGAAAVGACMADFLKTNPTADFTAEPEKGGLFWWTYNLRSTCLGTTPSAREYADLVRTYAAEMGSSGPGKCGVCSG